MSLIRLFYISFVSCLFSLLLHLQIPEFAEASVAGRAARAKGASLKGLEKSTGRLAGDAGEFERLTRQLRAQSAAPTLRGAAEELLGDVATGASDVGSQLRAAASHLSSGGRATASTRSTGGGAVSVVELRARAQRAAQKDSTAPRRAAPLAKLPDAVILDTLPQPQLNDILIHADMNQLVPVLSKIRADKQAAFLKYVAEEATKRRGSGVGRQVRRLLASLPHLGRR